MALFRFHRGSLNESLKTTVIVKNTQELKKHILRELEWTNPELSSMKIEQYGDDCFDSRIGWYTYIVTDKDGVLGFLSEPLS